MGGVWVWGARSGSIYSTIDMFFTQMHRVSAHLDFGASVGGTRGKRDASVFDVGCRVKIDVEDIFAVQPQTLQDFLSIGLCSVAVPFGNGPVAAPVTIPM